MSAIFVRIDDRLIHGQVINSWIPKLSIEVIVVADPRLVDNPEGQLIAQFVVPEHVVLKFVRPEEVHQAIVQETRPTMILFPSPCEALRAIETGLTIKTLNLGNLHFESGKVQLCKTFCCNSDELTALKKIADAGVHIEYQPAPELKSNFLELNHSFG